MSGVTDYAMWAWCWVAYRLVLILPIQWRLSFWLLPYAGYYAYSTPESGWRWSERQRCRPRPPQCRQEG